MIIIDNLMDEKVVKAIKDLGGTTEGESFILGNGTEDNDLNLQESLSDELSCKSILSSMEYVGTYDEFLDVSEIENLKESNSYIKEFIKILNDKGIENIEDGLVIALLFDENYSKLYLYGYEYNKYDEDTDSYINVNKYWEAN